MLHAEVGISRTLTIPETAKLIGVSDTTIRNWLKTGFLPYKDYPAATQGRQLVRIRKKDVDEFLLNHYIQEGEKETNIISTTSGEEAA